LQAKDSAGPRQGLYAGRGHMRALLRAPSRSRTRWPEGRRFEDPLALDERYDLVVLSRWVHIAFPAASPLTASKDFVTWSAGEILSSADEKTATILESGAMTNVVRSVNA